MMSKRSSAVSMAVVVSAVLPACALDDTAGDESPPGSLAEAFQPLATSLPQCDPQSPGYTPGVNVQAIPRSGQAGYWRSFPNPGVTDPVLQYEQQFWSIFHANGYEYEVQVVIGASGNWIPVTSRFFLVGITDAAASPPYLMSPPAPPAVRRPIFGVPFSPLASDHASEESLDLADSAVPPVWSDSYPCVTVLDASGVFLDFFPLAGRHDPSGQPW